MRRKGKPRPNAVQTLPKRHPLRCAIYCRVSTAEQADRNTIASQLQLLPEHARKQGWQVIEPLYIDNGHSGTTIEGRPDFVRLLADVEAGLVDVVLVIDVDRLTRSEKSWDRALIFDTFRVNEVLLATPGGVIDLQDDAQSLSADIIGSVAAFERRKINSRLARGKRTRTKEGVFRAGKDPYGYRWESKRYVVVDAEAVVVRRMYELVQIEGVNMLTWRLNEEGFTTRKGGRWRASSVRKILTRRTYYGDHIVFKGEGLPPIPVPPIVSRDVWARVQQVMRDRKPVARSKHGTPMLSGLLKCGICQRAMWLTYPRKGHGTHAYYRCSSTNSWRKEHMTGPCGQRHHRQDVLEEAVWTAVCAELREAKPSAPGIDRDAVNRRIAELEAQARDAVARERRKLISREHCEEDLAKIANERIGLEAQLYAEPIAVPEVDLSRLDELPVEARRELIRGVGEVTVQRDGRVKVGPDEQTSVTKQAA